MNKLLTKIVGAALGLSMTVGVGVAVASQQSGVAKANAAERIAYTLDGTIAGTGNNYTSFGTATQDSVSWKAQGNLTMNPWRIGNGKNGSAGTRLVQSQNVVSSQNITKIVITTSNIGITPSAITLKVGNSIGDGSVTNTSTTWETPTKTITRPDNADWTGKFFEIGFTIGNTASKFFNLNSIDFYYDDSASVKTITIGGTDKVGSSGLSITATLSGVTGTPTWASNYSDQSKVSFTNANPTTMTVDSSVPNGTVIDVTATIGETVSNTKKVVVSRHAGTTQSDAFEADEATALTKNGVFDSNTTYFVAGYIKTSTWSDSYNNGTIYVTTSENNTSIPDTDCFEFFKATSQTYDLTNLSQGTYIIASGKMTLYNSTQAEMSGCSVVYVSIPSVEVDDITLMLDGTADAQGARHIEVIALYEVSYVDAEGTGTITVDIENSEHEEEGFEITEGPANGSFKIDFTANDTYSVTITSVEDDNFTTTESIVVSGIVIPESEKYGEYTGAITAGKYVIVADSRTTALTAGLNNNRFTNTSVTIENGVIEDPTGTTIWTIAANGDYWTLYNEYTNKYAGGTTSKNQAALLDSVDDHAKWTISYNDGYVFQNYGRSTDASDPANAFLRQNSTESNGWATYSSSTGQAPTLYKLDYLPKAFDHFNYVDSTPDRTEYMVGETFEPAGLEIHAVYTEPQLYAEEDITDEIVWDALVEGTQATGSWEGHQVTITGLTISSFTPVTFTKLTSLDQLAIGSEVIIGGYKASSSTYYVLSTADSKYFDADETTGTTTTLKTTSDAMIFTVEADSNGYYFQNNNKYISRNNSDSAFTTKTSNSCWNIAFNENGEVIMTNGDSGNTAFQFNDSTPRFKNYSGTQKNITIYVKTQASEANILKTYVSRYLNPGDGALDLIPSTETGVSGDACLGPTGLYRTAKAALTTGEFASYNDEFQASTDSIVKNARLRYEAWARAYGDSTPYSENVSSSRNIANAMSGNTGTAAIISIIAVLSLSAVAGYFMLRKRKEQ